MIFVPDEIDNFFGCQGLNSYLFYLMGGYLVLQSLLVSSFRISFYFLCLLVTLPLSLHTYNIIYILCLLSFVTLTFYVLMSPPEFINKMSTITSCINKLINNATSLLHKTIKILYIPNSKAPLSW